MIKPMTVPQPEPWLPRTKAQWLALIIGEPIEAPKSSGDAFWEMDEVTYDKRREDADQAERSEFEEENNQ